MDARKFAVEETGTLELRDHREELIVEDGKQATVTIYGPGSKTYAKAQAAQSNRLMDKLKRKGKTEESAEEKAREQSEFLASITKEFQNFTYGDLQGEAMFKAIYADRDIGFIADQVAKFASDWANFNRRSPTS